MFSYVYKEKIGPSPNQKRPGPKRARPGPKLPRANIQ